MNYSDMPTAKFAKEVVNDTLSGAQGIVWKGGNTTLVRMLVPWLPTFILVSHFMSFNFMSFNFDMLILVQDRLMLANGRGISKMPKA